MTWRPPTRSGHNSGYGTKSAQQGRQGGGGEAGKPEEQRVEPRQADDDRTKFRKHKKDALSSRLGRRVPSFTSREVEMEMDARRSSVGLYACYRYSAGNSFLRLRYGALSTHMHAQQLLPLYTLPAPPLAASPSPSESRTTTQELKNGVSYTTPHDLARKNPSRIEKRQTDTEQQDIQTPSRVSKRASMPQRKRGSERCTKHKDKKSNLCSSRADE